MQYFTFRAGGLLDTYVKHFWVLEGQARADQPYFHHLFADTCPELLFYYKGHFFACDQQQAVTPIKSGVTGQSHQGRKLVSHQHFGVFGVYLYPHAVAHLFGIGAVELNNQMLDLKTLLGKEADELEEKMMLAGNHAERLQIIRSYLEKKVLAAPPAPLPMLHAMQHIQQQSGHVSIPALAAAVAFSTRQFERNFRQVSGLSPKLYARIVRFQAALQQLQQAGTSLTKVAYAMDYYDQAHFIRDFKLFSGLKPKEFLKYHQKNALWLAQ